jgi:uncharacterized protein YndB with AHSA1/START domain
MTAVTAQTTQVYQVLIKASAQKVWDAITKPEFTSRYFHGSRVDTTGEAGTPYRSYAPDGQTLWIDEMVYESDPPRRLVHGWRHLWDPEEAAEPSSRVTWEIQERDGGVCLLTVTHDELENSPKSAASVSGIGWRTVLDGLKTLLETGEPLFGLEA